MVILRNNYLKMEEKTPQQELAELRGSSESCQRREQDSQVYNGDYPGRIW